jgi:hypothetical protein
VFGREIARGVLYDVFEEPSRGGYRCGGCVWVLDVSEVSRILRQRVRHVLQLRTVQEKGGTVADASNHRYRAREWV